MASPTSFAALGLADRLAATVAARGYDAPTPIQAALLPPLLAGRDAIGQAPTGTGKTAAFTLPMLQHLGEGTGTLRGLVLTPTRELAKQVADAVYTYGQRLGVRVLPIYGGTSYGKQIRRLKKGTDVVVGTPGRVLDLLRKGALDLSRVTHAVLDEADEMLSMGFIDDIEAILGATPEGRQTAFFSATLSRDFERLAARHLTDPATGRVEASDRLADAIEQRYYVVSKRRRLDALQTLLEVEDVESAIVFARTRAETFELAEALMQAGYRAGALNGEMDQSARTAMLARFRDRRIQILVGTNVAARGLDIDHVSHVINVGLPRDPEVYVHRIGRTGRAGATGTALTLVAHHHRGQIRKVERYTKQSIAEATLPTAAELADHRDARLRADLAARLEAAGDCTREYAIVADLVEQGYGPLAIAAAALKAARGEAPGLGADAPDEAPAHAGDGAPPAHAHDSHEDGMVRLRLDIGHKHGTRPGQVVGALAGGAGMPGKVIGRIDIHPRHTLVDVPERYAGQVRAQSGTYRIGNRKHVEVA
jgi:ATP-dependent RNA helicase DeaD